MTKFKATKVNIATVFVVILAFSNLSAYAQCDNYQEIYNDGYEDGIRVGTREGEKIGIQKCTGSPHSYGLYHQADLNAKYSEGVTAGKSEGVTVGKQACINNPASCGLYNQADLEARHLDGITTGKQECIKNPTLCELYSQADLEAKHSDDKMTGRQECINNPSSCELYSKAEYDAKICIPSYSDGRQECIETPENCFTLDNKEKLIKFINDICNRKQSTDTCGITIVTDNGIKQGEKECRTKPQECFPPFSDSAGEIPSYYCDNKTKNCASGQYGELYLPTVDYVKSDDNNKVIPIKGVSMDIFTFNDQENFIFVYKKDAGENTKKLTITKAGKGEGAVISYPSGIECNELSCTGEYAGTSVELFAVPQDSGSFFAGWEDHCRKGGNTNHFTLLINSDKQCTAKFEPIPGETYTLFISDVDQGTVTSDPSGIQCSINGTDCTKEYAKDALVTLTAQPPAGDTQSTAVWGGDCGGSGESATVIMSSSKQCTVEFVSQSTLTIEVNNGGRVQVKDNGDNNACSDSCSYPYETGKKITLIAKPNSDQTFEKWIGNDECKNKTSAELTVTMDFDKTCTATFTQPNND